MSADTNVLALPLTTVQVQTGTNEDWIDALVYLVDSEDPIVGPQLDLRGIQFEMEIRHETPEHEVVLSATTENGRLSIGAPPDYGYLIIAVPLGDMRRQLPGDYVGDIRAIADGYNRVCIQMTISIIEGVTR